MPFAPVGEKNGYAEKYDGGPISLKFTGSLFLSVTLTIAENRHSLNET